MTASKAPADDAAPAALFRRIDHVGVAVPDLDDAIAFYRDTFGLYSVHEEINSEQGVREALLGVGDGETRIQLLAPLSADSPIARFLDRSGPGVQQIAYTVDDVDAVAGQLRERGLRVLYAEGRPGTAGSRVNFIHPGDAGGVLIELVEPAQAGDGWVPGRGPVSPDGAGPWDDQGMSARAKSHDHG